MFWMLLLILMVMIAATPGLLLWLEHATHGTTVEGAERPPETSES